MNQKQIDDISREVACSCLPDLAGVIGHLEDYEQSKNNPDQELINFYKQCRIALWKERDNFYKYTDDDIRWVFNEIAPILKKLNLCSTDRSVEQAIFAQHEACFRKLILEQN